MFTTGNIPLFSADSSPYINIDDIAVWLDYGIAVVSSSNETRRREGNNALSALKMNQKLIVTKIMDNTCIWWHHNDCKYLS